MAQSAPRALVTGASSGIGRQIAIALAEHGYDLVLDGRDGPRLGHVAAICKETGRQVVALTHDLTDPGSVAELVAACSLGGRLDLLVNNAGLGMSGRIPDLSDALIEKLFRLNVLVPLALVRGLYPLLKQAPGTIVNVSSVVGIAPLPFAGVYSATKFAVTAFSRTLRAEARQDGVRVITLYPGGTDTSFIQNRLSNHIPDPGRAPQIPAVPPERVATALMRALDSGREEVFVTSSDAVLATLARIFPSLADRATASIARRVDHL